MTPIILTDRDDPFMMKHKFILSHEGKTETIIANIIKDKNYPDIRDQKCSGWFYFPSNKDLIYLEEGMRHRLDGPAYYKPNNEFFIYFKNDVYHRIGGPAVNKSYYIDGQPYDNNQYWNHKEVLNWKVNTILQL